MLCRLRAPVRCFASGSSRNVSADLPAARKLPPLRILFCGSDQFSIASLRVLDAARKHVPGLIDTIQVVHRPPKPTGRGLKVLKEVPIKYVAEDLGLPTHVIDTFTAWTPPLPLDLVVAVSFGLFVPPRILALAKYGGLNVHPSLLPDMQGPAPIEHTILRGRRHTGVSVQTLDPRHFDRGAILAQTPSPGCSLSPPQNAKAVEEKLGELGAAMLLQVLKARTFMPPLKDTGWYGACGGPVDHAPKIVKQDRFVDFNKHTLDDILRTQLALGDPWCTLENGDRLIIHHIGQVKSTASTGGVPGIFAEVPGDCLLFRAACGNIGSIVQSTYAGFKLGHGNAKVLKWLKKTKDKVG